jgi:hypothetical protein
VPGGRALLDAEQLRTLGPDDKVELAPAEAARRLGVATPVTTEIHVLGPRYEQRDDLARQQGVPDAVVKAMELRQLRTDPRRCRGAHQPGLLQLAHDLR